MRISDWSSDVCSSDLLADRGALGHGAQVSAGVRHLALAFLVRHRDHGRGRAPPAHDAAGFTPGMVVDEQALGLVLGYGDKIAPRLIAQLQRSEEHTSELQSLMRISYAVFCLKKNNNTLPT